MVMSFEDIAKEMNCSPNAVKKTYWRAIKKLRKQIKDNPDIRAYLEADNASSGHSELLRVLDTLDKDLWYNTNHD